MRIPATVMMIVCLSSLCALGAALNVPDGCRAAPDAKATVGGYADRIVHEKTAMEMVFIPAGIFTMGINDPNPRARRPSREVVVRKPFYIGKTEVTNAQYRRFLEASGYEGKGDTDPGYDLYLRHFRGKSIMPTEDEFPVVWVSWKNAAAFCEWAGLAIPSEAQWEYACRARHGGQAGTTTIYYFGNDEKECDKYGWIISSKEYYTHAVAQKLPNAWGLYDTLGNVWEWTGDDYIESFEGAPKDESPRLAGRMTKVLKGGCWGSGARYYVTGSGGGYSLAPTAAAGEIGFRAILAFDAPESISLIDVDTDLVARYTFEEGGGDTVLDTSGRANHGKNAGATYVDLGDGRGFALSFDTPEALVDCGNGATLDLRSTLTMEYWLFAKTKPLKGEVGILGKGFASYLMSFGGRCWFYINSGKNHCFAPVSLGEWHHLAATYDRKTMRFYVDGELSSESELGYGITQGENFYLRCPLAADDTVEGAFEFMLDDVRIYNRVLTAEEIAKDYREEVKEKK